MPDGLLVPLLDNFIQLATLRQTTNRKLFEDHIEPLYKDLHAVTDDYVGILTRLLNILEAGDHETIHSTAVKAKEMIEEARIQLRLKRVELRSIFINGDAVQRANDWQAVRWLCNLANCQRKTREG